MSVFADFADPWEHARMLADTARNAVLIETLRAHAPGATVLEVGCGTGLFSVLAARLGARRVIALEPTELWREARALVRANGLEDVVEVRPCTIESLAPGALPPVDLAFCELLSPDPLSEGLLDAMAHAALHLAPGGRLAPAALRLGVALVGEADDLPLAEARRARAALDAVAAAHQLALGPLADLLQDAPPMGFLHPSPPVLGPISWLPWWTLGADLDGAAVEGAHALELPAVAAPAAGAVLVFEARYATGAVMHNRPGAGGHWGHLVSGWARPLPAGVPAALRLEVEDDHCLVWPPEVGPAPASR